MLDDKRYESLNSAIAEIVSENKNLYGEHTMSQFAQVDEAKKVSIQVSDMRSAMSGLSKHGVKAKRGRALDEIEVSVNDRKKVVDWMIKDGGFNREDIKDMYPELLK
jgi:hypothetical protein